MESEVRSPGRHKPPSGLPPTTNSLPTMPHHRDRGHRAIDWSSLYVPIAPVRSRFSLSLLISSRADFSLFLVRSWRGARGMKIQCDACEGAAATVICCADEAALCAGCDVEIHGANKLASKHQRLPLETISPRLPRCDVCQEKAAFIFCVEDRALFCRDCDEPIHVAGTLSGNHQRYLATGIRVGFSSRCANPADVPKANFEPPNQTPDAGPKAPLPAPQEVPSSPFLPSGWAVDDFLQLSDYESGDKLQKESPPLGFRELEWLADIDVLQEQVPKGAKTAPEVPELFGSQAPSDAAFYRVSKAGGARQSKKARVEIDDDEDYLIVPDLG